MSDRNPVREEIEKHVQAAKEHLPDLDTEHLRQHFQQEYLRKAATEAAKQIHGQEFTSSYQAHMKWGADILRESEQRGPENFLIQDVAAYGSTNLVVAPTNGGGSTLQGHIAYCLLTGKPFLGLYVTHAPPDLMVLWLNPEEQEDEPVRRLADMGVPRNKLGTSFLHIHTKQQRFYANQEAQVQMLIADLDAMGILTDPRPKALIVDGFRPTLTGDEWGKDLEDWKNGMGLLTQALSPVITFARTQVVADAARKAKRGERKVTIEDAVGAQIANWPDNRFTVNYHFEGEGKKRQRTEHRQLEVVGRRDVPLTNVYAFDEDTWHLKATGGGNQKAKAIAVIGQHIAAQTPGSLPSSERGLSTHILDAWEKNGSNPPSDKSVRRAISQTYAYNAESSLWESAK